MKKISISAKSLIGKLLNLSRTNDVCFLDSCGVNHLNSHLLIAGIDPVELVEIRDKTEIQTLSRIDGLLSKPDRAGIFTVSYDFGLKLQNLPQRKKEHKTKTEPDFFVALFDCLIIHDYSEGVSYLKGNVNKFEKLEKILAETPDFIPTLITGKTIPRSNFSRKEYLSKIEIIQEEIKKGNTYQTNLTQQFWVDLPSGLTPPQIYWNLRKSHPAPFASFIKRKKDLVISISPERFIKVEKDPDKNKSEIRTSPIKGTSPRGKTPEEDLKLKNQLMASSKDIAENTMIVDLLRNDLGRISEFGTVRVEKLCELEKHPTIFHLVSTISGVLRKNVRFSEILKATFPCGSITGCPKISTMKIIDQLESSDRGLSMGTIGFMDFDKTFDSSVAIRTMVIQKSKAYFNVGGGIVIDSCPQEEYKESLLKAKAIFEALGVDYSIYETN